MDRFDVSDRIKKYRSLLGISQGQLANDKLNLNLIKSIEARRRNLTPLKASILVENLKKLALSKGISLNIETSEFLMSNTDYARQYCLKKLDNLYNSYDEIEYKNLFNIAQEFDLNDLKISIYNKIAEHYYNVKDYLLSLNYYEKALNISNKICKLNSAAFFLLRIGTCYFCLNNLDKSILYYNECYNLCNKNHIDDPDLKARLFYNTAFYYKKTGDNINSIKWLNKSLTLKNNTNEHFNKSLLLKANIFLGMEKVNSALKIYKYLLKADTNYIHIVYHNMAYAYYQLKKQNKTIELLNKTISLQLKSEEFTISLSLMDLGYAYFKNKMYRESIIFYQYSIESCLKYSQIEYFEECFKMLLKLYRLTNDMKSFNKYSLLIINIYFKNREIQNQLYGCINILIKDILEINLYTN